MSQNSNNQLPRKDLGGLETSMTPQLVCEQIASTTSDLIDLLNQETIHLKNNDFDGMSALAEQKEMLTSHLARLTSLFKHMTKSSHPTDKADMQKLHQHQLRLREAVSHNKEAINTIETVSKRLLSMIADQNAGKKASTTVYNGHGALTNSVKNPTKSVQINQNF